MAFCFDCGKEISRDADICPGCGKKFKSGIKAKLPFLIAGIFGVFFIIAVIYTEPSIVGLHSAGCKNVQTEEVRTFIEQEPYNDFETVGTPLRYYVDGIGTNTILWVNYTYREILTARIKNVDEVEGAFTMIVNFNDSGTITTVNQTYSIPAGKSRLFSFNYDVGFEDRHVNFTYSVEPEKISVQKQVVKFRNVTKLKPVTTNKTVC